MIRNIQLLFIGVVNCTFSLQEKKLVNNIDRNIQKQKSNTIKQENEEECSSGSVSVRT